MRNVTLKTKVPEVVYDQTRTLAHYPGGTHTGNTALTALATVRIPANLLNGGDLLRITALYEFTKNANLKAIKITLGDQTFFHPADKNQAGIASLKASIEIFILGRNSQVAAAATAVGATSGNGCTVGAVNLAVAQNLTFWGKLGKATDEVSLPVYRVEVVSPGRR